MKRGVQKTAAVDKGEILRRLSFIDDPVGRIVKMLEHGLYDEAWKDLDGLLVDHQVYFQHVSRAMPAAHIGPVDRTNEATTFVCFVKLQACFSIEGLAKIFGWKKSETQAFAERIIELVINRIDPRNMRTQIASWAGSWEQNALMAAIETYLPETHELRPAAERWLLTGWLFGDAYLWGYVGGETWLKWFKQHEPSNPTAFVDPQHARIDLENMIQKTDQWCHRMIALGVSLEEVHELLIQWLERFGPESLNPDFIIAVACSKTLKSRKWQPGPVGGQIGQDRINVALGARLPQALEWMFEDRGLYRPEIVARLRQGGMHHPDAKELFLDWSAEILSRGHISRVSVIWHKIGASFGVETGRESHTRRLQFDLSQLAASAFDKAVTAQRMGIAAALVLTFGEEACFDRELLVDRAKVEAKVRKVRGHKAILDELVAERQTLIREVLVIAQTMGQPVRLDYTAYVSSLI